MHGLAELTAFDFAAAGSPEGKAWIAALPSLLQDLARRWNLVVDKDQVRHGYNAAVFPVHQGGRPLALKLAWPPGQSSAEANALAAWRARGTVELVATDEQHGALLLERLDAARSLAGVPVAEAAAIAGTMIRALAVEAPGSFPSTQAVAHHISTTLPVRQQQLHDPVPAPWMELAVRLAASLAEDPARLMVHADLHYGNILASDRPAQPWVAIDPAPVVGSPERSVAELLWTRADELPGPQDITGLLDVVIDNGQLDRAKATAWAFVRAIDYWLWGLANGLTIDPVRCRRIARALAPVTEHGA